MTDTTACLTSAVPSSPGFLLTPGRRSAAFELKFLLPEGIAKEVEGWAAAHLLPDPHCEPDFGNAYRVTSLYLDTVRLDVFHRIPPHRRRKLRIRGYGSSPLLFLEQKARRGDRVRKRRTAIAEADLARLSSGSVRSGPMGVRPAFPDEWPGDWFVRRLMLRGLRPSFQIGCLRSAFVGPSGEEPVRLTLDRQLSGVPNHDWRLRSWQGGFSLIPGQVVLELKYRDSLPALFKQLLDELVLSPCPVSKYRLAVRAWNPEGVIQQVG